MATTYEGYPIETEPAQLALDAHAFLTSRWPEYRPSPANFDSGTIDAHARIAAEVRDIAANVPDAIFRRYGELAGVPPIDAAPASLSATVTAIDNLGYTLPAGTTLGLRATGDVLYLFTADDDVTIAVGDTVSPVFTLTAQETGAGPNDLGGLAVPMVVVDRTLPWLSSAQTATTATGGADAETTTDFLNRLTRELRLSAPRPILTPDFVEFAVRDASVARAYAINRYLPGTNERQRLGPHDSTGGTWTATWNGQTTAAIVWNASAATIQAALDALSNLAPGEIAVTGGPLPAVGVTVEFTGDLAESNVASITTTGTPLTGGSDTVPVVVTTGGVAPDADADKAVTTFVIDADGEDPGQTARQRIEADLNARREAGFLARVRPAAYETIAVTYAGVAYPGWDAAEVKGRVDSAIAAWLSPARRGLPQPDFGEGVEGAPLYYDPVVSLTELVQTINQVDGFWRLTGPGANGLPFINGSAADHTLAAYAWQPFVLTRAGTISGSVTAP